MTLDVGEFTAAMRGPGTLCWYAALPFTAERRAKLDEVLRNRPDITSSAISRVVKSWGFDLSHQSVRRHRQGDCECGKRGKP